jgi:hypothetical protein
LVFPLPGQVITLIHIVGVFVTLGGALLVNLRR